MKPRTIIPLIIGLGVGFFAIKMGIDMVQKAKGDQGDQVSVLVSAQTIEVATGITESMLATKQVPRSLAPSDAFLDVEALTGRVTAMSVASGVPITKGMLAPPGAEPGLRAKIPAGHRAVSISVTEESAVAGFVMPGSRVDVFTSGCEMSKLIVSDVEIGAVGQSMNEVGADGKTVRITKSVTLFLKPEEVELLPSGRQNLRLALRGNAEDPVDNESDPFWSRIMAKALEQSKKQPLQVAAAPVCPKRAAPPSRHVVEVVRGREVERLVFVESRSTGKYELAGELADQDEMGVKFGDSGEPSAMEIGE